MNFFALQSLKYIIIKVTSGQSQIEFSFNTSFYFTALWTGSGNRTRTGTGNENGTENKNGNGKGTGTVGTWYADGCFGRGKSFGAHVGVILD